MWKWKSVNFWADDVCDYCMCHFQYVKNFDMNLAFHLYQRCFSKLAVLVFYSADKKKSDRQCRMAVLVLMCYLAAVCQVKNRHTQSVCKNSFGTTEKHFKRHRQRFVKGSADMSTNLCPDGTWYTRTRTRRKRTFSCGYLWSSGCLWVWTDSLRQIWSKISGCWRLHLQHLPYKKVTWMLFRCLCRRKNIRIRQF